VVQSCGAVIPRQAICAPPSVVRVHCHTHSARRLCPYLAATFASPDKPGQAQWRTRGARGELLDLWRRGSVGVFSFPTLAGRLGIAAVLWTR
jgi:hypothetical protein